MEDLHNIGGIPAVLKYLINHTDLIDGSQMTVTGRTLAQNLEHVEEVSFGNQQDIVRPLNDPIKKTGHITILRGNLAPGSAVAKLTGKEGLKFEVCLYLGHIDLNLSDDLTGCCKMLRQPRRVLSSLGRG
jgi:dihydroxy-acid dehydratase